MEIEFRSSVAADSFLSHILHKEFVDAERILKEDGKFDCTFEEAWHYVLKKFSGTSMKLVPITKESILPDHKYLIRIGSQVFFASAKNGFYRIDLKETVFFTEKDMFLLDEVDEVVDIQIGGQYGSHN